MHAIPRRVTNPPRVRCDPRMDPRPSLAWSAVKRSSSTPSCAPVRGAAPGWPASSRLAWARLARVPSPLPGPRSCHLPRLFRPPALIRHGVTEVYIREARCVDQQPAHPCRAGRDVPGAIEVHRLATHPAAALTPPNRPSTHGYPMSRSKLKAPPSDARSAERLAAARSAPVAQSALPAVAAGPEPHCPILALSPLRA